MRLFRRRPVFILSIDGGGIRGIIPALVLRHMEKRLSEKKSWKPVFKLFDLIAGTSTGGLLALGLSAPKKDPSGAFTREPMYMVEDIVKIYEKRGIEIFPRWIFNNLRGLKQAFYEKYDAGDIEKVLDETFRDTTLNEALTNLLITSYDTEAQRPLFFKHRPDRGDWKEDLNFYMKDVARATSAAPTYFQPAQISPVGSDNKKFCLIDGGVFANNPAMAAYIEARKIFPKCRDFFLLSLGTGYSSQSFGYDKMRKWGYLDWIRPSLGTPLFSLMSRGQSECVNHELTKLPGVTFLRIDGLLEEASDLMDDASPKNIGLLKDFSEKLIKRFEGELDSFCNKLK